MTATLECELRAAVGALRRAREELAHATTVELRAIVYREIAAAEMSVARVLHLISGRAGGSHEHVT